MQPAVVLVLAVLCGLCVLQTQACEGHDKPCVGDHGTQSTCCQGLYCHKSNPGWAEGRCYNHPDGGDGGDKESTDDDGNESDVKVSQTPLFYAPANNDGQSSKIINEAVTAKPRRRCPWWPCKPKN